MVWRKEQICHLLHPLGKYFLYKHKWCLLQFDGPPPQEGYTKHSYSEVICPLTTTTNIRVLGNRPKSVSEIWKIITTVDLRILHCRRTISQWRTLNTQDSFACKEMPYYDSTTGKEKFIAHKLTSHSSSIKAMKQICIMDVSIFGQFYTAVIGMKDSK